LIFTLLPVPAQAKPSAIAAPHRTCGLYDSANKLTTDGNCSGVLNIIKYLNYYYNYNRCHATTNIFVSQLHIID